MCDSAISPLPVLMALTRAALIAAAPPLPLLMPLTAVIFKSPAFSVAAALHDDGAARVDAQAGQRRGGAYHGR
jgi:hypothetical protein